MKNRIQLVIGFLAIILSFTLGYSLGQAQTDSTQLQGNFDAVNTVVDSSTDDVVPEEAAVGDMDVLDIQSEWNSETQGLEITFEVINEGEKAAIGEYVVNAHLRMQDGNRNINFIDSVEGRDTREIKTGESVFIKAYMPGDVELTSLVEANGYEVKNLDVEFK